MTSTASSLSGLGASGLDKQDRGARFGEGALDARIRFPSRAPPSSAGSAVASRDLNTRLRRLRRGVPDRATARSALPSAASTRAAQAVVEAHASALRRRASATARRSRHRRTCRRLLDDDGFVRGDAEQAAVLQRVDDRVGLRIAAMRDARSMRGFGVGERVGARAARARLRTARLDGAATSASEDDASRSATSCSSESGSGAIFSRARGHEIASDRQGAWPRRRVSADSPRAQLLEEAWRRREPPTSHADREA